ncbi:exonuclease subunit SbcC [Staphylococcus delphini]|uniref:exonuclease subunit SbcC n=1 Tax=Staphylococcus delphini TaxID=53344 RepID=UPI0023B2585F|nr:exonuclease subunit SbcC [Staphylococcus delphini]MDE9829393.1 SMC family ATPase [Staphylococcus delphini]
MKPLKLHLQNFGPFLDETIDFSRIQSNQLFLISGKTGSGKTMIFDGIVYALYGRASTEKREVKHLRSHFADATQPLTVTFEFEISGRLYKVVREASFLKPGNKNETKPKLEVYRHEAGRFELIESTIQAGERFILDLLKLKQDQFRQLFVLPQGEFKEFLVSNSTDKQTILRTLFNTQLYDMLKNRLTDKTKNMKIEIDQIYTKIQSAWDELYTLDHPDLVVEKGLKSEQYDLMMAALPRFETIAEQQVLKVQQEKLKVEKELNRVNEAVDRQILRQQLSEQQQQLKMKLEQFKVRQPHIQQLEQQLKLMNESQMALKLYQNLQELEVTLKRQQNEHKQLQNENEKLETEQIEQQEALETHLLQEDEMNQKAQYLERTRHFYQECEQLKEKYARMTSIEQTTQKLVQHNEEAMRKLEAIDKDDIERQPDYEQKSQLQAEQAALVEKIATLRIAQNHATIQARQQQQLQQYTEDLKRIDAEIAQQQANIQAISENEQQLLNHEQAVMTLRATLSQNDPCPVCGQTVHHVEADADIEQIKKIQQENRIIEQTLEKLKEQKIKCEANITHTKARLAEIGEVDFNEEDLKKAETEQQDIKQKLEAIDKENSRIAAIQEEVGRIHRVIDENQQQIRLLKKEQEYIQERMDRFVAETAYDNIEAFQTAFTQLKSTVDQFNQEKVTLTERRDQLATKIKEQQYEIQLLAQQITERTKQVQTLNDDIDEALEALNIQNRETLFDILQDSVHKEAYEQEVTTYNQEKQTVELKIQDVSQQLCTITVEDLDVLKVKQQQQREAFEDVQRRFNEYAFQATQNQKTAQKIKDEVTYLKNTLNEQIELFQLAEILSGKNAHHLTLENYVLMHYLEQILLKANQRLLSMTGQRYELVRNEKKGRGFSGLEIEVFDYYSNQARHITSLSGGETFQASLALALGLSEVVQSEQGGIALDAMFIDEGFGTLDQETLETALDTLIQLQSSGRLVGIISHVSELKNRIPIILEVISKNYQSTTHLRSNE